MLNDAVLNDEGGMALITALAVSLAVFAVMGVAVSVGTRQETTSAAARRSEQALAVAEAGVNAAMSNLARDSGYAGADLVAVPPIGEFSVSVNRVSSDPADPRRHIVSTGHVPSRAALRPSVRRIEQEVTLVPTDGFTRALFAGAGGISGANNMTVDGDVYAEGDLVLANRATVAGSITSLGGVTTTANSTVGGDIRAAGPVRVDNSSTTVLGSVYSGADVTLTGRVNGNVQAAGTITGGTVQGSRAPSSPPEPPRQESLPTFTWDPQNYPSSSTWPSPGEFRSHWAATAGGVTGHHRVLCPAPCSSSLALDAKWTMADDVTIASDAPILLSRDIANGAGRPVTLTIVSLSTVSPAIVLSNNLTLPPDVRVVLFAPDGTVEFTNRHRLTGAVYARSISLDQQFSLTYVPVEAPGFRWDVNSSSHFRVEHESFKEVAA